jgi:2'-phosphotransferase
MDSIKISKIISYYLRHELHTFNTADKAGYVLLDELLTKKEFSNVSEADIKKIVKNCKKNRFHLELKNNKYNIRANQGHSLSATNILDASLLFEKIEKPLEYCVHGTFRENLPSIIENGLQKMNRNYIHFAAQKNAKSGFRKSCNVFIHIDMEKAMKDGMEFFLSENNVILTRGLEGVIDPKYFLKNTEPNPLFLGDLCQ